MSERKKVTLPMLFKKMVDGVPITMLTCYDYPTAYFQEQAGVDMVLVGDSLGAPLFALLPLYVTIGFVTFTEE